MNFWLYWILQIVVTDYSVARARSTAYFFSRPLTLESTIFTSFFGLSFSICLTTFNLAKHNMFSIKPGGLPQCDEKVGGIHRCLDQRILLQHVPSQVLIQKSKGRFQKKNWRHESRQEELETLTSPWVLYLTQQEDMKQ